MLLLITGCIKPNKDVFQLSINNSNDRLNQYLYSIDYMIKNSNFDKIVFCENSNFNIDLTNAIILAKKHNKRFEYLTFTGDSDAVIKYGKGYGEGEIIKFTLANSKLLSLEENFWKLTGRLWIENINKILNAQNENKIYFNRAGIMNKQRADTRFYKINKEIYKNYFLDTYKEINDYEEYYLENAFADTIKKNNIKTCSFPHYPLFRGKSGSNGIEYNESLKEQKIIIKEILCRTNLFRLKS